MRITIVRHASEETDSVQLLKRLKHWLWDKDIHLERTGPQLVILGILSAAALVTELAYHHNAAGLLETLRAKSMVVFYNVQEVALSDVEASIAAWIVVAAVARIVFGALVGIADIAFYRKITGKPFDWEAMINVSVVNVVFLLTTLLTFTNPAVDRLLDHYGSVLSAVPTLVDLNGPLALIVACYLADFCYYWSHRWSHKIRFFWNLGHVNHHRSRNLSQVTQAVDPQSYFLDVAGGKVFVLVMLPILTKLFSLDFRDGGWALVVLVLIDAWTNPSHSVVLYHAEIKSPFLRMFRSVLITPGVHFTHHSREEDHNITDGCNFGARFTLWDRLFGTYVEPPQYIPETGLYGDDSDYCRTPLRFIFYPYIRMFKELHQNHPRYWPAILFGSTSYHPPVPVKSKY
ncbi:sterol desaturase family protein [Sorangium sp. So ce315]|uniref:sterol desaturase family protein n=1 Tax=Sorangium sp. So ce315 TaxID=3133299 RepID=UPI003F606FAC